MDRGASHTAHKAFMEADRRYRSIAVTDCAGGCGGHVGAGSIYCRDCRSMGTDEAEVRREARWELEEYVQ